jgi:voltage-gated potassium channel
MENQFRFLAFLLSGSFVITTSLFWLYEPVNSVGDVVWWWLVSSTTVGYGDISHITWQGRVAGAITIITGIYCYTNFLTLTAGKLHGLMNRERLGTAQVNCKGHIVICEYTAFADELLQVLPHYPELAHRQAVVVTDLVGVNPYPHYHFVRGVPISPSALQQANIQEAAYIFVFSNVRFQEPDLKTLHTVSRIQTLNKHAKIFVEMHNPTSEFMHYLNRSIIVLKSRELLESVLKHKALDLSAHFSRRMLESEEMQVREKSLSTKQA